MTVPWDSPLRTRNIDEHGREISKEDMANRRWFNITSINDPPDVHRWIEVPQNCPLGDRDEEA